MTRRKTSRWRLVARERIKEVGSRILADNPQVELKKLRSEISKAYPFGLRENHPYKMWLFELNAYMKLVKFGRTGWQKAAKGYGANKGKRKSVPVVEGQLGLFDQAATASDEGNETRGKE